MLARILHERLLTDSARFKAQAKLLQRLQRHCTPGFEINQERETAVKLLRTAIAVLVLGSMAGCAAFDDAEVTYSDRILLGAGEEIVVPKTRWRLDEYTCGARLLVCEDHGPALRCRCGDVAP
jgi:hypothetical protein